MTYIEAIILGIVEGITEFLPVSSTGHMLIVSALLDIPHSDFVKTFEIAIQLGAITAVAILYWKKIIHNTTYIKKIFFACIPAIILGAIAYPFIKDVLFENLYIPIIALGVGGVVMIGVEQWYKKSSRLKREDSRGHMTYAQAIGTGFFQVIAFIPGVSRSAATILGGILVGLQRSLAAEFSFLIAIPTMLLATGYDLSQNIHVISNDTLGIFGVGFLVSALVAYASVRLFVSYVQKNDLRIFGWYRIIIAIVLWFVFTQHI